MADCILMQLGSNLHWDQTCKTCKCMQSGMQDLHWIKLSKLAIPVSRKGPGVQTIRLPFWEVDGLKATEYNRRGSGLRASPGPWGDLLRHWEGGQATYCSRRGALPETAGCTITLLRRPQQTSCQAVSAALARLSSHVRTLQGRCPPRLQVRKWPRGEIGTSTLSHETKRRTR